MASLMQAALPLDLFDRLQRVRRRYAAALQLAGAGDFGTRSEEMRIVSRYVGRLLAKEARKSPDERGGLRMLDLSLAVDRYFPELRGWTQHELLQRQLRRMRSDRAS